MRDKESRLKPSNLTMAQSILEKDNREIIKVDKIKLDRCEHCQYSPMCYIQHEYDKGTMIVHGEIEIVEVQCQFFKCYEPFREENCEGWKEGIRQFANMNGDMLREAVENFDKETNNGMDKC